eukprot:5424297-Pleurochrysis_carterae.AAC.1
MGLVDKEPDGYDGARSEGGIQRLELFAGIRHVEGVQAVVHSSWIRGLGWMSLSRRWPSASLAVEHPPLVQETGRPGCTARPAPYGRQAG